MIATDQFHADMVLDAVRSARSAAVSPVAASWCRSALHHQLDPSSLLKRDLLAANELRLVREAHEALISVATPVLDQTFRSVGRSGCGVVLSDAMGNILESRVNDGDLKDFVSVGLVQGARWSEAEEGTNGIGTCLFEDKPVIIHRDQHFASRNIGISCMDAPVHDPHGRLFAAIDVSSCRDDHSPALAEMIVALVRDAARRIERDYFCQYFSGARIVFLGEGASGNALLAVDRDDLVIGASRAARIRLGLTDEMIAHPTPVDHLIGTESAPPSFEQGDRSVLRRALAQAGGNASQAARTLGIGRATLYRRMARAGLRDD